MRVQVEQLQGWLGYCHKPGILDWYGRDARVAGFCYLPYYVALFVVNRQGSEG